MVLPICYILSRVEAPVTHVEGCAAVLIVPCQDVQTSVVHNGCWIRAVKRLDNGVVGTSNANAIEEGTEQQESLGQGGNALEHSPRSR